MAADGSGKHDGDGSKDLRDALEQIMLIAVDGMNLTRLGSKEDTAFRSICRKALVALREKQTDLVLSLVAGGNLICFGRQAINAIVAWQ